MTTSPQNAEAAAPALEASGITVTYGAVTALADANLHVAAGEIHGLIGKNGSGKSTLASVIAGSQRPDRGEVRVFGRAILDEGLAERQRQGIRLLSQHATVIDELTVAENLFLNRWPGRALVSWPRMRAMAEEELARYGLDHVDPRARVRDIEPAERRKINIARALVGGGRLVVMDEPTTALSQHERDAVLSYVQDLAAGGTSFVYISHHSPEVLALCARVTVLRDGHNVSTGVDTSTLTVRDLHELIAGAPPRVHVEHAVPESAPVVLEFSDGADVPLQVRAGEVVSIVSRATAQARDTARAMAGFTPGTQVAVAGTPQVLKRPRDAQRLGVAYLSSDRHLEGLGLMHSVRWNMSLGVWPTRFGMIDQRRERTETAAMVERLQIHPPTTQAPVGSLSGGNQQKVYLARVAKRGTNVCIFDEPSLGVDVGARQEIHELILELANRGVGVVLVGSDLEEIVTLADRCYVLDDAGVCAVHTDPQLDAVQESLNGSPQPHTLTSGVLP